MTYAVMPMTGWPTVPGRVSHSSVVAQHSPPSDEPKYSMKIGPHHSTMRRFSGMGHGSPPCITSCNAGAENAARCSSGSVSSWRNIVGTIVIDETSCWIEARARSGSHRAMIRSGTPRPRIAMENVSGAPWNNALTMRCQP